MNGNFGVIMAGALLMGALLAAPAQAGDSFHFSLGVGNPYPYVPGPVVVSPYYYGGVVVAPPPPRWRHHQHYAPPRHYVWTTPPRHHRDGWHGHDRRWR